MGVSGLMEKCLFILITTSFHGQPSGISCGQDEDMSWACKGSGRLLTTVPPPVVVVVVAAVELLFTDGGSPPLTWKGSRRTTETSNHMSGALFIK